MLLEIDKKWLEESVLIKVNVQRITGYKDRNDYNNPEDDNTKLDLIMDSRSTKENIEEIMAHYWSKFYRSVAIKAELLDTKEAAERR